MSRSSLSGLSDRDLLGRLKSLVEKERATTLEVLLHLNEVERRRLYLSQGFPSLFDYCTRHLGYSSSAAGRRIHAARCVRDFPRVLGLLEKNEVQLSSVCLVAPILTRENQDDLLARIRNKSQRQIEGIVAEYRPPVSLRDRARPVCVAVPEGRTGTPAAPVTQSAFHSRCGSALAGGFAAGPPGACTGKGALLQPSTQPGISSASTQAAVSPAPPQPPTSPTATGADASPPCAHTEPSSPKPRAPVLERKLLVQFLASEAFMEKFEKARALLSKRLDEKTFERVFEAMIDEFLERHSPEKRNARRRKREGRRHGGTKPAREVRTPDEGRHIPAPIRDRVFERDKGRCTYVGKTGERCRATHGLEIDHIVPYARGGGNTAENLRTLCAQHNRLEAERVYGANAIRRYRRRE